MTSPCQARYPPLNRATKRSRSGCLSPWPRCLIAICPLGSAAALCSKHCSSDVTLLSSALCEGRDRASHHSHDKGSALAPLLVELLRSAMRGGDTQTLKAVRAAAALRAHGQGGYLGECIRGERTALRQAVHPNGTPLSSTVSWAVMRPFIGGVRTFLTLNQVGASEASPGAARPPPARA